MSTRDLFGNPTQPTPVDSDLFESAVDFHEEVSPLADTAVLGSAPESRRERGGMFTVFMVAIFSVLVWQCFRLQVLNASENRAAATGNSVRILTQQADRGLIIDRSGQVVAQNDRRLALMINPQTLPRTAAERETVYAVLREKIALTNEERDFIEENRSESPEPFPIRTSLSQEESLLAFEWFADVPGVQIDELPTRRYADVASLGHLLGYVGTVSQADLDNGFAFNQRVGKTGVERQYNELLTGTPGKLHAEVNALGETIRYVSDALSAPPIAGQTLRLTLDLKLQEAVATALQNELERRRQKYGDLPKLGASAVVLDPRDGSVLAMVSLPDYPSNTFAQGISQESYTALTSNPGNPLLNRAIQGAYAPGSTLKPLVAAAGLQEGLITANTSVVTPEAITIGSFRFPDWKYHGQTNTRQAIAESNNIFFYALGGGWEEGGINGLGIERLNRYLRQFGLGGKTGIDLPGEQPGLVPSEAWKEEEIGEPWYIGNTYQTAIGQGYLNATPLQMALGTAVIANGGTLWQPRVVGGSINPTTNQEQSFAPVKTAGDFVSPRHLQTVREGMREAVEYGSARLLNQLSVTSAGKTGTAQFGNQGLTHAWYTGFAPFENPEIAFAVVIEGGGESFYSSVPVAEEILRAAFNEPLQEGQRLFSEPTAARVAEIAAEFSGER